MVDEYQKVFGESWRTVQEDSTQPWPYLNEALTKFQACKFLVYILWAAAKGLIHFVYFFFLFNKLLHFGIVYTPLLMPQTPFYLFLSNHQDPAEADKLLKIQRELDETKIILVSTHWFPASIVFQSCIRYFVM